MNFLQKYVFQQTWTKQAHLNKMFTKIRLESLMEFYDYIEDIEQTNGKLSNSHIDNLVNLIINIAQHFPEFNKNITDIKYLVRMIQGDYSKIEYFLNKLFFRYDNAQIANSIIQNAIKLIEPNSKSKWGVANEGINWNYQGVNFTDEEWTAILNRAESGIPTYRDIFYLLCNQFLYIKKRK